MLDHEDFCFIISSIYFPFWIPITPEPQERKTKQKKRIAAQRWNPVHFSILEMRERNEK